MKIWILLGVLSISAFSSEFAVEKENEEVKNKIHHSHHHLKNTTMNSQNHSLLNKNFSNDKSIPKNIILMIVEDNQGEELWKKLKQNYSFPIKGFFSNCHKSKLLDNSSASVENKNCHCEKLLKKNINELLTWAQLVREMDTATISGGNFTLPSVLSYGNSVHVREKFNGNIENGSKPTILRFKPQSGNFWLLNDTNNQSTLLSLLSTTSSSIFNVNFPINRNNANNAFWNFINTVSQMHLSFFKTIFNAIRKHFPHDRVPSSRKSVFPIGPPKFTDLILNTLMDLKLTSNDKGFLFIIVTPENQLSAVNQIIQHQIPINNTLMVITGKCSKDERDIPYFASGLQPHFLWNTSAVFELPIALKLTLNGCHGICDNKTFPLAIPVGDDTPKKRVARSGDDDEAQQDDEKVEESDSDLNGNEDASDNGEAPNSDRYSSDLDFSRDESSTSSCITSSLTLEFILSTIIMFITYM